MPEEKQYSLTCFSEGAPGRLWAKLSAPERKRAVLEQIGWVFGSAMEGGVVPSPVGIIEKMWTEDRWSEGAPSPVPGVGIYSRFGHSVKEGFGCVHVAGTETSDVWTGYMEGAVRSGVRAAGEVIGELQKKGGD